ATPLHEQRRLAERAQAGCNKVSGTLWEAGTMGIRASAYSRPEAHLRATAARGTSTLRNTPSTSRPQERQHHHTLQWRGNRGVDRGSEPDRCITIDSGADHLARSVRSTRFRWFCNGKSVAK